MTTTESADRILPKTVRQQVSTGVGGCRRSQLQEFCLVGWLCVSAALALIILRSPVNATGDFVYFYSIGRLLSYHPSHDLYNYEVQQRIYDEVQPSVHGLCGPSPYPPFVALFFRLLARMPFFAAYHVWSVITICLYVLGLWLLLRTFLPEGRTYWSALFCGAFLFWPFLARTLTSGQIAAVGFFAMSAAISEQQRRHYCLSGLSLSLCLYKPTLVLWIIPLLLVARAWRTLAGFSIGAAVLACISAGALDGLDIWRQYADMTVNFSRLSPMLNRSQFLDVLAVVGLARHGATSVIGSSMCLGLGAVVVFLAWRHCLTYATEHQIVAAWAITLPLGLLVNVYTPIYDSLLLIVSLIATARWFRNIAQKWLICGSLLLLAVSFCTTWIADAWRIQIFSLLIAGVSAVQLCHLNTRRHGDLKKFPAEGRIS